MLSLRKFYLVLALTLFAGMASAASHEGVSGRWITVPGESVGVPGSVCSVFRPEPATALAPPEAAVTPAATEAKPEAVKKPVVAPVESDPVPKGYTSKTPTEFCSTDVSEQNHPAVCFCGGAPWNYNKKNGLCQARVCEPDESPSRLDCVARSLASKK